MSWNYFASKQGCKTEGRVQQGYILFIMIHGREGECLLSSPGEKGTGLFGLFGC